MIPRLLEASANDFSLAGIPLTDTISCVVTEERNGLFELEMVVATTTPYFEELAEGKIIVAKPNHTQNYQAFEIYEITRPIDQRVKVRAQHISYRLSYIPVKPFTATGITETLDGLVTNSMETNPFTFTTTITNEDSHYAQMAPYSLRRLLGGLQGSLLDVFGGEFLWNNFTVQLLLHRGQDNGVELRVAKNISALEQTKSMESVITGVLPYWSNTDGTISYYGDVQYNSNASDYSYKRTSILDLSEQFEDPPTLYQMNQAGQTYVNQANLGEIKTNIKLSFVDLADTEEYKDSPLERINLCDTVKIYYAPLDISYTAKAIKLVFDVLAERTLEIEVGEAKSTISKTISGVIDDVDTVIRQNGKIVSVVQKLDEDVGEWSSTIAEIMETGVKSIKPEYALSTSNETVEQALIYVGEDTIVGIPLFVRSEVDGVIWTDEMPEIPGGYYLWERDLVTWLDDTQSYENLRCLEGISGNTFLIYSKESQIIQRANEILQRVQEVSITGEKRWSELSVKAQEISGKVEDENQKLWSQVNQNTKSIKGVVGTVDEQGQYIELASQMLDEDGLHVKTSDTDMESILNGSGLTVKDANGDNVLVASGTDKGVVASNLTANNYLILNYGSFIARFEPYSEAGIDTEQIGIYMD